MELRATTSFSGLLGAAGKGQVVEVDDKTGEKMIAQGYPVEEVAPRERKRGRAARGDARD